MKLLVSYPTTEKRYRSAHTYTYVLKTEELEVVRIVRYAIGRNGAAANRFRYQADFKAPADAAFVRDGMIRESFDRKVNKHFKPKELLFINNVCDFRDQRAPIASGIDRTTGGWIGQP